MLRVLFKIMERGFWKRAPNPMGKHRDKTNAVEDNFPQRIPPSSNMYTSLYVGATAALAFSLGWACAIRSMSRKYVCWRCGCGVRVRVKVRVKVRVRVRMVVDHSKSHHVRLGRGCLLRCSWL